MNQYSIATISNENPVFCTMVATTRDEQKAFYNAVENPEIMIGDMINKKITIKDVHMERASYTDEDGVVSDGIKSVIITPDGTGIISPTSVGLAKALFSIFNVFGTPDTWGDDLITVEVKQVNTKRGRYFKLEVVD